MRPDYNWKLPDKIVARLGQTSFGRQRAIFEDDHLLLILHNPPGARNYSRETLVFLRQPNGQWLCNGRDDGLSRLKKIIVSYEEQIRKLLEEFQSADLPKELFEILTKLNPVKRAANDFYVSLQAARDFVKTDNELIDARDRAYETSRNCELLYLDAQTALNFKIAKNAQDDADAAKQVLKAQHKLNILAAVFFPLTALTTLFGMNLPSGLSKFGPVSFWLIFACGLVIGSMFKGWVVEKDPKSK